VTRSNHGAPNPITSFIPSSERKLRHVGDFGNIEANALGVANVGITDTLAKMDEFYGIVGRSIVVHADEDDLGRGGHETSLETGNSGARVACCVIRPVQNEFLPSGARCERSHGGGGARPRCALEHECCGGVIVDEESGAQVEVCHDADAKKYPY